MVMNPLLTFADWHKQRNLDTGMVGFFLNDPTQPENPLLTTVVPRIVTLNAGQTIFRWVHSATGGSPLEKAAGPWWSTKRGAQAILRDAKGGDTAGHARAFSNIARSWGSDLGTVVCATVTGAIKCFLGVGRAIYDEPHKEVWDSGGHQLYIPNMSEKGPTGWTLSKEARANLRVDWVKPAAAVSMSDWEAARAGTPLPGLTIVPPSRRACSRTGASCAVSAALLALSALIGCRSRGPAGRSGASATSASTTASAPAPAPASARVPPSPGPIATPVAIELDPETTVLSLVTAGADPAWGTGPFSMVACERLPLAVVRRGVDPAKLPPEHRAWSGAQVVVVSEEGKTCDAVVSELFLGLLDYEDGKDLERCLALPPAKRGGEPQLAAGAERRWNASSPRFRQLLARVRLAEGCRLEGAPAWGQKAGATVPAVVPLSEPEPAVKQLALEALRADPIFAETQRRWTSRKARPKDAPPSWTGLPEYEEWVGVARDEGGSRVAYATARVCRGYGGFTLSIAGAWLIEGTPSAPRVVPYWSPRYRGETFVMGVADVNHDAKPDLVLSDGLLLSRDGKLDEPTIAEANFVHTCPGIAPSGP